MSRTTIEETSCGAGCVPSIISRMMLITKGSTYRCQRSGHLLRALSLARRTGGGSLPPPRRLMSKNGHGRVKGPVGGAGAGGVEPCSAEFSMIGQKRGWYDKTRDKHGDDDEDGTREKIRQSSVLLVNLKHTRTVIDAACL